MVLKNIVNPISTATLLCRIVVAISVVACCTFAKAALPYSPPQAQDINIDALAQLITTLNNLPHTELHHLIVVRNGRVVTRLHALPYRASDAHNQFSACKTLTALAVGLAIEDGKLSLSDDVASIFANKYTNLYPASVKDITVRNLLTMTSGKDVNASIRDNTSDWVQSWLSLPSQAPGKRFAYDTMSSFMLSAIVEQVTGRNMLDYLQERILSPMGIDDAEWEQSPSGISTGGWGLRINTESMAMMGQLMLQHGRWNGKQLIGSKWIDMMTSDQLQAMGISSGVSYNRWDDGYGFQLWRCGLDGAYRAQGNYGQFLFVYPPGNLVIAINCSSPYQMQLLNVLQQVSPRLVDDNHRSTTSLKELDAVCATVAVPLIRGTQWASKDENLLIAVNENRYNIKQLEVRKKGENAMLSIHYNDGNSDTIALGYNQWIYSKFNGNPIYNVGARNRFSGMKKGFTVAGNYAWSNDNKLVMQYHFVNWYSSLTITINLNNSTITFTEGKMANKSQTVACHLNVKSHVKSLQVNVHKIVFIAFVLILLSTTIATIRHRVRKRNKSS